MRRKKPTTYLVLAIRPCGREDIIERFTERRPREALRQAKAACACLNSLITGEIGPMGRAGSRYEFRRMA